MNNFEQTSIASLKLIRGLLKIYDTSIFKNLGQNFLINQKQLFRFINLCNIKSDETIVEIGPGVGTITFELCKLANKVILIELDKSKEKILKKVLENYTNYEIIWNDAAKIEYENLFNNIKKLKIIGSLPFNISKKIISRILTSNFNWEYAYFIVQKEVGEQYTSQPPKGTFLYNFVNLYADVKKEFVINKINYYPIPKVDSIVISLKKKTKIDYNFNKFATKIIKQGFKQPRKNILNNLRELKITEEELQKIQININKRPAELKLSDWINIATLIFNK